MNKNLRVFFMTSFLILAGLSIGKVVTDDAKFEVAEITTISQEEVPIELTKENERLVYNYYHLSSISKYPTLVIQNGDLRSVTKGNKYVYILAVM